MRKLIAGTFVSMVLWTAGCSPRTAEPSATTTSGGQTSQAPAGTTAARNDTALVRFINADPDGKGMDVWSSGSRTFSNIAYKTITPYMQLPAHVGQFQLREPGGTEDLAANRREMAPGRHYTLVALPKENHSSRLAVMRDNLAELEPGNARVRLINATPDVDDLHLYIAGTKTRVQQAIDASVVTSFTDVDPGTLEIRSGTKPAPPQLSNLKVEGDRLYTFIVTGTARALDLVRVEDRIEDRQALAAY